VAIVAAVLLAGGSKAKPSARAATPISVVRVDGHSGNVAALVRDRSRGGGHWENLWQANGTLWQLVGRMNAKLVSRSLPSGRIIQSLPLGVDACTCKVAFGYGSVWLLQQTVALTGKYAGFSRVRVDRIDELSD